MVFLIAIVVIQLEKEIHLKYILQLLNAAWIFYS